MRATSLCAAGVLVLATASEAAFAADARAVDAPRPAFALDVSAPGVQFRLRAGAQIAPRRTFDRRWALNTAVTAGAVVFGVLAAVEFRAAQRAFRQYLDEPDDETAVFIYDTYVVPNRTGFVVASLGSLALAGAGVGLWVTTDLTVGGTWRW